MNRFLKLFCGAAASILLVTALSTGASSPAQAKGGIAISGSFYRHHFQMLPGETFSTPDVYVIIFNNYDEDIRIKLVPTAPEGATVHLEEEFYDIPAGKNLNLPISVSISEDFTPGDYDIYISADVVPKEGSGIAVVGAAQQRARLSVFGEAANLSISTITRDGKPFAAKLHLYRLLGAELSPAGYSDTGQFSSRLVPGDYMVQLFYDDYEVAKHEFTLEANEDKQVTLTADTVFIRGFFASPRYDIETERIAFASVVYTIKNIYERLYEPRAVLLVAHDGTLVEETVILTSPALDTGDTGGSYNYIPDDGWKAGEYSFILELRAKPELSGEELVYATSTEQTITVSAPGTIISTLFEWRWLIIIILAAAFIVLFIILFARRRKKKKLPPKPKAKPLPAAERKKRKEEPAPLKDKPRAKETGPEEEAEKAPAAAGAVILPSEKADEAETAAEEEENILEDAAPIKDKIIFENFEYTEVKDPEAGGSRHLKLSFKIINQEKPLSNVSIVLKVQIADSPEQELSILKIANLKSGKGSASYNYAPAEGWQKGKTYSLQLKLLSAGVTQAVSETLQYIPG